MESCFDLFRLFLIYSTSLQLSQRCSIFCKEWSRHVRHDKEMETLKEMKARMTCKKKEGTQGT